MQTHYCASRQTALSFYPTRIIVTDLLYFKIALSNHDSNDSGLRRIRCYQKVKKKLYFSIMTFSQVAN